MNAPRRLPLDAAVVPCALMLIARELAFFQPTRELCWQLFHDTRVARKAAWLGPLLPAPSGQADADPFALLLAAVSLLLALAYLAAGLMRARPRVRGALLVAAAVLLVAVPTALCIALGEAMKVPYGHDGGVVQLPLAMDKVLAGESPYGADYSKSVLGRQSRSSEFWAPLGGNPIVRHHWYLPGVHLLMIPPYVLCKRLLGFFDPRLVTLAFYFLAAWLATRLVGGRAAPSGAAQPNDGPHLTTAELRLCAAAVILIHPLVWWPQVFGVNDVFAAVPLLLACLAADRGRPTAAAAWLGLACAVKQLLWPFAPFLLVFLSGVTSWRELLSGSGLKRLARPALVTLGVCLALVAPLALRDAGAFVADIFRYQVGLAGEDQYPIGGTPGFGFANFAVYFGWVKALGDPFPFSRGYVCLVPLGLLLLQRQLRQRDLSVVMVNGSVALLASLYLSRIVNPNYLILAALFLPLGVLRSRREASNAGAVVRSLPADLALVPLALFMLGLELVEQELMRSTWESAATLGRVPGLAGWLQPGDGPRWRDPLSLGLGALAAGVGIVYLIAAHLGAPRRVRLALVGAVAALLVGLPTWVVVRTGAASRVQNVESGWFLNLVPNAIDYRDEAGSHRAAAAWSKGFKPPPERGEVYSVTPPAPHRFWLRALLGALGQPDPRLVAVLALVLGALIACAGVPPEARPSILGLLLLSPVAVVGATFGAGDALVLCALLAVWRLSRWRVFGAALGGVAGGLAGYALPAAPLLLAGVSGAGDTSVRRRQAIGRRVAAAAAFAALLVVPVALLWPYRRALLEGLAIFTLPPGHGALGLVNLFIYRGLEYAPWAKDLTSWLPPAFALIGVALAARRQAGGLALAGGAALAAVWVWPAEPHALLLPFALTLLAAVGAKPHGDAAPSD